MNKIAVSTSHCGKGFFWNLQYQRARKQYQCIRYFNLPIKKKKIKTKSLEIWKCPACRVNLVKRWPYLMVLDALNITGEVNIQAELGNVLWFALLIALLWLLFFQGCFRHWRVNAHRTPVAPEKEHKCRVKRTLIITD